MGTVVDIRTGKPFAVGSEPQPNKADALLDEGLALHGAAAKLSREGTNNVLIGRGALGRGGSLSGLADAAIGPELIAKGQEELRGACTKLISAAEKFEAAGDLYAASQATTMARESYTNAVVCYNDAAQICGVLPMAPRQPAELVARAAAPKAKLQRLQ